MTEWLPASRLMSAMPYLETKLAVLASQLENNSKRR
jgi:hypothetical protein